MKHIRIYTLCIAAIAVMSLQAQIKVLSLNNSLIDYNDQNIMFNNMCTAMGKNATWTKHTNLGKTLAYHYNEDPLDPNAKTVIANESWDYIILQEQSSLPRENYDAFRSNVQTWVSYIRTNCPKKDAVVILPINWAYSDDGSFQTNNRTLITNYRTLAADSLTLCPVAIAYGNYQIDHPSTLAADLYTDNRHPTLAASYLACCLEYAMIFGENPNSITWKPDALDATKAATMRAYAQEAYEGTERTKPLPPDPTPAVSITGADAYTQNFDAIGGEDVTPVADGDGKTAYSRETSLPTGWRIERNTSAPRTIGSFAAASEKTMYIGGTSLASNDKNGTWNFGATGSTDRAIGGITTSISGGTRAVNVMVHLHNDAGADAEELALAYDIEKYRNGANDAGFIVQLYTSSDGETWTNAGSTFLASYAKDADTNGSASLPIHSKHMEGKVSGIEKESDLYLAWNISVASGTDCAKSMAFGIDNVVITPKLSTTGFEGIQPSAAGTHKTIQDGQLVIRHGKETYNAQGARVN